jgi:hypothetical protein
MTNISFAEGESNLSGENQTEPASGAVSGISGMLHYKFKTQKTRVWYAQFTFPIMAGQGSYLSGGGGMEFYWGQTASRTMLKDATTSLVLSPVTRYFTFAEMNIGYLAYLTETAKKNDTMLEIGGGGGLLRKFDKWTLRAQAGIARGVGIVTTTMGMKVMVGGTFFLD